MVMKIVSIKIDESDIEKLDAVAKKLDISRSEVIRIAIREYLKRLEKGENPEPIVDRGSIKIML